MATNSNSVREDNNPSNTTFQLGVSLTDSRRKPHGKEIAALRFQPLLLTKDQLVDCIRRGHTLCHNFGHSVGEVYPISHKTNKRFQFANAVMIDVDDSTVEMSVLVDSLCLTPSIAFTTYSNGVKGFRFRLIYLFSDRLNAEEYKAAYRAIVEECNLTLDDNCMSSYAQCSFTNGSGQVEIITSDEVYSLNGLGVDRTKCKIDNGEQLLVSSNKKQNPSLNDVSCQNCTSDVASVHAKLRGKNWEDYIQDCLKVYQPTIHTPLNFTDGYAILDDNYIEIQFPWYLDFYEVHGERRVRPAWKRIRKGEKRHKKLYFAAILRRRIKPEITLDELVFNAIYDITRHYDNTDKKFTNTYVVDMCKKVMAMNDEELNQKNPWKDKRGYRLDHSVFTTRKERQHARRAVKRTITDNLIKEHYDNAKSDKENLAVLSENGINISRQRLTQYKNANGIKSLTKAEMITRFYNANLSDAQNLELLKENGLVVSLRTLQNWKSANGFSRKNTKCKIDNGEQLKKNTQSLNDVSCQNCTSVEEVNEVETTKEETSIVDDAIREVEGRCKPGYKKKYPTLQDYMKPLGDIIKDIPTVAEVIKARDCFNKLLSVLQYNGFMDKFTITAYNKLFEQRIKALEAA